MAFPRSGHPSRPALRWIPTAVLGGVALWWCRPGRAEVDGHSMAPTLPHGTRLLVCRGALARRAARGAIVLVRAPGGREVVKRIVGVAGDIVDAQGPARLSRGEVAVEGDDPLASTDSRRWGALPRGALRGRVLAAATHDRRYRRAGLASR